MKKWSICALLFCLCLFSLATQENAAAEDEPLLPEWVSTARRAEIITFGSLPFTTLGVTLVYGTYEYVTGNTSSFPNPLDKSSSGYDTDEIKKIVGISLGVSGVLALTDFIIGRIKKNQTLSYSRSTRNDLEENGVVPLSSEELSRLREQVTITSVLPEEGEE